MLKLFYAPATCALASNVALEEAGAQYETVRLDFGAGDQRKPEYPKINDHNKRMMERPAVKKVLADWARA